MGIVGDISMVKPIYSRNMPGAYIYMGPCQWSVFDGQYLVINGQCSEILIQILTKKIM